VGRFADQVNITLPAHGNPFTNTGERVQQIKDHHAERLQKLRDVSIELNKPATVMEFAQHLFSPRAQGSMADSEAYAHLEHLRILGEFERRDNNGAFEYVLND